MPSPRELDEHADAVLIAVLRLVVASGGGESSDDPFLLTSERVELLDDAMREGQRLAFFEGDATPQGRTAAAAYRRHRETIDPLWAYVESHGLPELLREAGRRAQASQPTHGDETPSKLSSAGP